MWFSALSMRSQKIFFFFLGGERMECWSSVKYTELSVWVYRDLIDWYEWLTLPSTCHCMYIESSQRLISSDVGAVIVPIVSLKKWRRRKGEVMTWNHLLPRWQNQDPTPGSWEAVLSCCHWGGVGWCTGLSASKSGEEITVLQAAESKRLVHVLAPPSAGCMTSDGLFNLLVL